MATNLLDEMTDLDQTALLILYVIGLFAALAMYMMSVIAGSSSLEHGLSRIVLFVGPTLSVGFGGKVLRYYGVYIQFSRIIGSLLAMIAIASVIGLLAVSVLLSFGWNLEYFYIFVALISVLFVDSILAERLSLRVSG